MVQNESVSYILPLYSDSSVVVSDLTPSDQAPRRLREPNTPRQRSNEAMSIINTREEAMGPPNSLELHNPVKKAEKYGANELQTLSRALFTSSIQRSTIEYRTVLKMYHHIRRLEYYYSYVNHCVVQLGIDCPYFVVYF